MKFSESWSNFVKVEIFFLKVAQKNNKNFDTKIVFLAFLELEIFQNITSGLVYPSVQYPKKFNFFPGIPTGTGIMACNPSKSWWDQK